jgi:hypothetical protein
MCLQPDWFERQSERNSERDRQGVSVREAEAALQMYHSTVYPVAIEMTEWILRNWSASEINKLQQSTRELLWQIARENDLHQAAGV